MNKPPSTSSVDAFEDENEALDPKIINLKITSYRTEEGKPWVLPVVHAAELQMASDETLNHEYLPVAGLPDFREAAARILLGLGHKVLAESKVESFQALGGTGALRLGAAFLKNVMKFNTVYISDPTWENHRGVFQAAGFTDIRQYRYWDNETRGLNIAGMCEDLNNAPAQAVILLHGVAHNPTGIDPTKEQWKEIARICKDKNLFVFVDCAYQGFASGNLDEDAWASRYLADQDIDMFVAQSFSKNFGLYNERVGNLVVITKDPGKLQEIRSQIEVEIRVMRSNPPNHGARIVATVLNNTAFFDEWKGQISTMANRIKKMRQELLENLKKLGTPGNWEHIIKQIGMFSYTGLTEKQVEYLKGKSIYLLSNGRISMCGLTSKNVAYVAKTMDESIRAHPNMTDPQKLSFINEVSEIINTFSEKCIEITQNLDKEQERCELNVMVTRVRADLEHSLRDSQRRITALQELAKTSKLILSEENIKTIVERINTIKGHLKENPITVKINALTCEEINDLLDQEEEAIQHIKRNKSEGDFLLTLLYDLKSTSEVDQVPFTHYSDSEIETFREEIRKLRNLKRTLAVKSLLAQKSRKEEDNIEVLKKQVLEEYEAQKSDPKFMEKKQRMDYLHQKLGHIKRLIHDYDQGIHAITCS